MIKKLRLLLLLCVLITAGCSSAADDGSPTPSGAPLSHSETGGNGGGAGEVQPDDIIREAPVGDYGIDLREIVYSIKEDIDKMYGGISDVMVIDILIREESVVYTCTYQTEIEDVEEAVKWIEAYNSDVENIYKEIADAFFESGFYNSALIIEYYTKDGDLIFEKSYKVDLPVYDHE